MKKTYEKPLSELYEIRFEGSLLTNSVNQVESMRGVTGYWDEEDD